MKFWEIFRFEFATQIRRVWTWLFFVALVVIAFLMTRDGSLAEALREDFFVNSPFAIAKVTVVVSLIWLLVAAAVAGEAAGRDVTTGMHTLIYTVSINKVEYLGGRLFAALSVNAILLLAIPAGNLLAIYSPGVDVEAIGPFRPAAYFNTYAFIALPNVLFGTAIQFSLATLSGRPLTSYLGSVLLFFMSYVVATFLLFRGRPDLANLLDPVGVHFIVSDFSYSWTTIEKSTRLIALEGTVLWNRLVWIGVGLAALAVSCLRFRFSHRDGVIHFRAWLFGSRQASSTIAATAADTGRKPIATPQYRQTFDLGIKVRQLIDIARTSFRQITMSWPGFVLLAVIPFLAVLVVLDQMVSEGVPLLPRTVLVIGELTGPLAAELSRWVIVPLLTIYFAGELIWRERDAGLDEMTDAVPVPEWVPLIGKILGFCLVLVVFTALQMMAGMAAQAILGYQEFEPGLYLTILFGLQLPEYFLFAVLAVVLHVLINQKYIAHLALIVIYLFMVLSSLFGVEHDLFIYGAGPGWTYTEMRGFGPSLGPRLWFKFYWAAWALLLAVVASLLWMRGRERGFKLRLVLARHRLTRSTAWAGGMAAGLVLTLGVFIFYNTNVLNEYISSSDIAKRRAEYERRYGQFATVPQPQITATSLRVEIYPERREVEIQGTHQLVNRSEVEVGSIHVSTAARVETDGLTFSRAAILELDDQELGHRIYALESPLKPGDSLQLNFELRFEAHGFRESGPDHSVVANGTVFTNRDWLPAVGYRRDRELTGARDRRKYGLAPRALVPSLYDVEARSERSGGVAFEAVVGTHENQVAVAPGELRRTWEEGGRRYFQYVTEDTIGNEYAIFSANYAVHEVQWEDVAIRIFHHPEHTANLDRMVRSIRASLDYYTREFGPYPYEQLTFVERPGNGIGMHADPSLITFTEGTAFWNPQDEPDSLDLPFAVVAHEMAHQWTVPYAFVEGAPVMSESLAWYYGMQVVQEHYGRDHLLRLLSFMRQPYPYPPIRRGEPLLQGLNPYLSYRKGPFALFALSEYIGVDRVNSALRSLLERHRPEEAPLATTLDLYRELKAVTPDRFQYLLHDLFEVNTFWQFETERATAKQINDDFWEVKLDVRARKVVADIAGVETEVPMDELVEIGVFASGGGGGELSQPLYLQKHAIRSGEQTITVTVPDQSVLAGIDPFHLLDWEEGGDDDNIEVVEIER